MLKITCQRCARTLDIHCCNTCGGEVRLKSRRGFSVAIRRDDRTEFLAGSGRGLLPPVFTRRKEAVAWKRDLQQHGFKCRVVPVFFHDVERADQ